MEFVRVKYANNKLYNANLKEHREIIEEYVLKKGYTFLGYVPVVFGPSGKTLEADLVFKLPKEVGDKSKPKNSTEKVTK